MDFRLSTPVVSVAAVLVNLGMVTTKAIAQTSVDFNAIYKTTVDTTQIPDTPFSITTVTGESPDAPFGLTNLESKSYSQLNLETGEFTFNSDPAAFGLPEEFSVLVDRFFGSSDNELIGLNSGTLLFDFLGGTVTGKGQFEILEGSGELEGATGTLLFTQNDTLDSDLGETTLSGSIVIPETVPEPSATATLVGLGLVGFLLRRQR